MLGNDVCGYDEESGLVFSRGCRLFSSEASVENNGIGEGFGSAKGERREMRNVKEGSGNGRYRREEREDKEMD